MSLKRRPDRREVLRTISLAAVAPFAGAPGSCAGPRPAPSRAGPDDALDEAYRRMQALEPRVRQGLSTHTPMAVEALAALGHPERIAVWMEEDRASLREVPVASSPIDPARWREALGLKADAPDWNAQNARFGDWVAFFTRELAEAPWPDVLDRWTVRLAPGLCAAATHGVIRTAHAARALSARVTPERRAELARGLGYWASAYQELPVRKRAGEPAGSYAAALARLPLHTDVHADTPRGNIVAGLRAAARLEGFADALDLVAHDEDTGAALSALTRVTAAAWLRHGTRHDGIAFIHAVTGPVALRRLAPHVQPGSARRALPYAWQAAAGIYAAYARRSDPEPDAESRPVLAPGEIAGRASESRDPHVVKFAEALLSEHAVAPDPVYLAAASRLLS